MTKFEEKLNKAEETVFDTSNVAYTNTNSQEKPKLDNILKVYYVLTNDFKFPRDRIKFYCDAALPHQIDDKEGFEQFAKEMGMLMAPGGVPADEFILLYVKRHPESIIITNDMFRKYEGEMGKEWIIDHRIAFMIVEDEVYFRPCTFKQKKSRKKKSVPTEVKNKNELTVEIEFEEPEPVVKSDDGVSALDIFSLITSSEEGEFSIYSDKEKEEEK